MKVSDHRMSVQGVSHLHVVDPGRVSHLWRKSISDREEMGTDHLQRSTSGGGEVKRGQQRSRGHQKGCRQLPGSNLKEIHVDAQGAWRENVREGKERSLRLQL